MQGGYPFRIKKGDKMFDKNIEEREQLPAIALSDIVPLPGNEIRIDVNNEYEVLYDFLEKLPEALAPNGRVAILTFHSGEDRLVKKSFKALKKAGIYSEISEGVIRPTMEECNRNPRARSTKMRWAIKA